MSRSSANRWLIRLLTIRIWLYGLVLAAIVGMFVLALVVVAIFVSG